MIKDIVKDVTRTFFYYENEFKIFDLEKYILVGENKQLSEINSKIILLKFCIFLNYIFPSYTCNLCFKNDFLKSLACINCSTLKNTSCSTFDSIKTNYNKSIKKNYNNNDKNCINDLINILYNYTLFYQNYDFKLIEMLNGYDFKYNLKHVINGISDKFTFFDTYNDKKIKYTVYYIFYRINNDVTEDLGYIVNVAYLDEPYSYSFNYVDFSKAPDEFFKEKTVKRGGALKKSNLKLHKISNKSTVNKYKFKRFTKRKT